MLLSRIKVGPQQKTENTEQVLTNMLAFIFAFYSFVSSGAIPSILDHVIFMLSRSGIAINFDHSGKLFFSDLTPTVQLLGNEVPILDIKGFHPQQF